MTLYAAKFLEEGAFGDNLELSSGQKVYSFHKPGKCLSKTCPVHKPADHSFRDWPLAFTGSHLIRILPYPDVEVPEHMGMIFPDYSSTPRLVVIDPDDYRYSQRGSAIVRNSGLCLHCGEHLVSETVHDYVACKCGKSFVDGGSDYLRRTSDIFDTSIVFRKTREG